MAEEIKVGDWVSFDSNGLTQQEKVLGVDDVYTVRVRVTGSRSAPTSIIGKGEHVKKIAPPEDE